MEKIKAALTGHSSHDAAHTTGSSSAHGPEATRPGDTKFVEGHDTATHPTLGHQHRADEIGAGHTQGHHDPEVEAKEATSQAGNYPYWGDLPKDGEHGHTAAPGATHAGGLATGGAAAAAAAAAAGAAGASSFSSSTPGALGAQSTTHENLPDCAREALLTTAAQGPSPTHRVEDGSSPGHARGEMAAATGAGAAGATYLGTHDHHRGEDSAARVPPASTGSGLPANDPGHVSRTSAAVAPQPFTDINDTSYAPSSGHDGHRREEGALAAGAGAAGLGGAGYLAYERAAENSSTSTTDSSTTSHGLQQREATSTSAPISSTGTVVGASSGEYAQRTTVDPREQSSITNTLGSSGAPVSGQDNRGNNAAALGLGAGAGAIAAEERYRHRDQQPSQAAAGTGTTGSQSAQLAAKEAWNRQNQGAINTTPSTAAAHDPEVEARQATSAAGNFPHGNTNTNTTSTNKPTTDRSALGSAAVGVTSTPDREAEARNATSAAGNYPHEGSSYTSNNNNSNSNSNSNNNNQTSDRGAAIGPAAGVGSLAGVGATAAFYGQGKTHDANPRSTESEKIAERALGSDGAAHAPSSAAGQGGLGGGQILPLTEEGAGSGAGGVGGSNSVVHKCRQCGADNDISEYFKKFAGSGN